MTENEKIWLHYRLYEYLKKRHEADPTFGFSTHNEAKTGYLFHGGAGSGLSVTLNPHAKYLPLFTIKYTYKQLNWHCSVAKLDFMDKLKTYSKYKRNQFAESLQELLNAQGFSKQENGFWEQSFPTSTDFIPSLDSFMKNQFAAIHHFFQKNPPLSEPEKDVMTRQELDDIEKDMQLGYVKERYRLLKETAMTHLPFALSRLEVIGFQGIKHLIMEYIPTHLPWIFLTGENGLGKTSVLRAIALGLVGDEYADQEYLADTSIFVNGYNWNQPFQHTLRAKKLAHKDFQVATYGTARFQMVSRDLIDTNHGKVSKKTYSLFENDGLLKNIERVLIDTERDDLPTFNRLKEVFLKIIPNLADIRSELIHKKREIRYYEKSSEGEVYPPMLLHELAAGYRGILTMIGDMLLRLSENPKNSLEDLQGIVLIDELDAHLHPKYQYELPKLLSDVFPKVQFIVSTHSPLPVLGAKPDTASVWGVHRTKSAGITVERLDDDIEIGRLSANALLTSDIFGFKNVFARGATPDTIESYDDYEQIKVRNRVEKLLALRREKSNK